ncbi:MAG: carbohydrate ABC transporter permease [Clostridia bacterium]|nr:carbohydrate ABC transporter permease [Clostridia bacterium]
MNKKIMRNPAMIIIFVIFAIYALSICFILFQGIAVSIMDGAYYGIEMLPTKAEHFNFGNYVEAFTKLVIPIGNNQKVTLLGMFINSLLYAVGTSFLSVIFSSITAYLTAKYKFPGRNFIYYYAIVTMMIPVVGSGAASIMFFDKLGVLDTYFMIFMFAGSFGQNYVILYATFKGVSWEYAEAAFIDGAGHFRVWVQVMIPQALSPMFALFMVGFIGLWSDSETSLLYMRNLPTIASGLTRLSHTASGDMSMLFAGFVMSMIPLLILYIAFQETIMDIQIGGGLKG